MISWDNCIFYANERKWSDIKKRKIYKDETFLCRKSQKNKWNSRDKYPLGYPNQKSRVQKKITCGFDFYVDMLFFFWTLKNFHVKKLDYF